MEDKIIQIQAVNTYNSVKIYGLSKSGKLYVFIRDRDEWKLILPSPHDGKEQGK